MFRNYFKIAIRNLIREKGYSTINILGLSVGLTVSLLILLWIWDEAKMDKFHQDGERIYRVLANVEDNGSIDTWTSTPYPLGEYLVSNFPEVEEVGAFDNTNKKQFVSEGREMLADGIYANDGFFSILSFPFAEGKRQEIFEEPNSVVISEKLASKLFGTDWKGTTVGEAISINGETGYKVTGVFEDTPLHSSLSFDFVLNLDEEQKKNAGGFPWGNYNTEIIFKLKEKADIESLKTKIANAIFLNNEHGGGVQVITQPYNRKYLYGQFENGAEAGGRINYVSLFGVGALFLLIIACINFMNLATARASRRAKEVGIRKTIGANKRALVTQFMTESAIINIISICLAVLFSNLLLPFFQDISGKELILDFGTNPELWVILLGIGLFSTLLAGSYPSFFLSSFRITNVLKGKLSNKFDGNKQRKALVVFQFVFSALLVIATMVVQRQVNYIKTKHLGLTKENILYFRTPPGAKDKLDTYKNELLQIPGIRQMTLTSTNPLAVGSQSGDPKWEGMLPGDGFLFNIIITDDNFLTTMNIPLAEGRNFAAELSTDSMVFLINETAAKAMNLDRPIGKQLEFWGVRGPIVGVVKDFHISSLHESIGPLIVANMPEETGLSMLQIDPNQTESIIAATESVFEKFSTGYPFRYDFLDERFLQNYRSEQRIGKLSAWLAGIALFISCLGLLGLSTFISEQKAKEISIRKVLGASVFNVVFLLSKDFFKLVGIALLIAFPLSWYLMKGWLGNYAFSVELSWEFFALAGGMAVLVTLLAVGFQSVKAALSNPVESLKSE